MGNWNKGEVNRNSFTDAHVDTAGRLGVVLIHFSRDRVCGWSRNLNDVVSAGICNRKVAVSLHGCAYNRRACLSVGDPTLNPTNLGPPWLADTLINNIHLLNEVLRLIVNNPFFNLFLNVVPQFVYGAPIGSSLNLIDHRTNLVT